MHPILGAWIAAIGEAPAAERPALIEQALGSPAGRALRSQAGEWMVSFTPMEWLVPEEGRRWRPLVAEALAFVFSRLSDRRLAAKIAEQLALPANAPPERRLIRLISRMPALQKMGQVLARNRRLNPALRQALMELENGIRDLDISEVRSFIQDQLGERLARHEVEIDGKMLSEASVSAVVGFSYRRQRRVRERGVFKALKPYVKDCLTEDLATLRALGRRLTARHRRYGFAAREIDEMLMEVSLLLEREVDFRREQAMLGEAARTFRSMLGVRTPRVIEPLCTDEVTAMTEENGVKVTDAVRRSPVRQIRVAGQIVQALIAAPLLSGDESSIFHADPHAGNLLYDEANRELIVLDWALAERLSLDSRRRLAQLAVMTAFEKKDGVREAVRALRRPDRGGVHAESVIDRAVDEFFARLPRGHVPGVLDAMELLDEVALRGVSFAAPLFLFRKSLFTLDGVLRDVSGSEVRMDHAILRQFATRWMASFGLFYAPFSARDLIEMEWNALLYPARAWTRRVLGGAP